MCLNFLCMLFSKFCGQRKVLLQKLDSSKVELKKVNMSEINRKRLKELLKQPENNVCADCQDSEPNYASITIGVFLCASCVQIHRKLGSHISRTKSLTHDNWDQSNVAFMKDNGNYYAKTLYEKYVPPYYKKPTSSDEEVLKEQWIRAKYERKEFMNASDTSYNKGYMEGVLYKKGKEGNKFNKRRFILSQVDGTLKYYVKDKSPKAIIEIKELNVTFCSKKLTRPYSLQLTYPKDGRMRNIFVYCDNGKTIVDWYVAIRAAAYYNFKLLYTSCLFDDLLTLLPQNFIKEGFLHKTGSKVGDDYKRRWFTLYRRILLYFVEPTDSFAKGEIYLHGKKDGYNAVKGIPVGLKQYKYGFTLITPERKWLFGAETEHDRDCWINCLNQVFETDQTILDQCLFYKNQVRTSSYKKLRKSNFINNSPNTSLNSSYTNIDSLSNCYSTSSSLSNLSLFSQKQSNKLTFKF